MTVVLDTDPSPPCVFCAILAGRAPASRIWTGEGAVAFMDLRQPNAGHVLVVPTRHAEQLHDLEPHEAGLVMAGAVRVARALRETLGVTSYSLWQSNGPDANQEVPHVHLHVCPRRRDDGLLRIYPGDRAPAPTAREALEAMATPLRAALARSDQILPAQSRKSE